MSEQVAMSETESHILLVEDEAAHAELIERAFASYHRRYRLTVAGSLREARKVLEAGCPDAILADLQLPDGRGTELLPGDGQAPPFPLVVLTSHGNEQVAVEAMKAGALDYVVKSAGVLLDIPRVAERALREWRLIHERKAAEEERRKLESRLQHSQKLESLGILAGGIAHDFNNLVMAMMGHARIALADLPPEAPARDSIADIETAAVRASELCRQLLTYSGRDKFLVEAIDLNQLVGEMCRLLETAVSKAAVLELDLAEELPAVDAAASQLRQVVMNLIMNASDALGGRKGTITVRTGTVRSSTREAGDAAPCSVYVEVTDTGCGMDAATQERIFDPFFTTKLDGRGLGMAAVKGIVRSHRGTIELESDVGRGTRFRVLFPAAEKRLTTAPVAARPLAGAPPAGAATVLVVDDDVTIRAVTTITLEGAGFLVQTAADGREALTQFRAHRDEIAVILLDLGMPELDGDAVYRELKEEGAAAPVIVCSGCAEAEATQRIPGYASFIQKPYQAENLIAQVRAVLRR